MTPQEIEDHFTRNDGSFAFARWERPIVPVVFGVDEAMLPLIKGAIEAVVVLARHRMAETDPELGANLMLFFIRDWQELETLPDLEHLVPDFAGLIARLTVANADQYRFFRFDEAGGIKAAFVFVRMGGALRDMAASDLALAQSAQIILLWGEGAFATRSPLAKRGEGACVLRPDIAALIRAAYDPVLPAASQDTSLALRLFARMKKTEERG